MLGSLILRVFAFFGVAISGVNLDVAMNDPVVELRGDSIAVSAVLLDPVSDDLMNIIDSGTPVNLVFDVKLRTEDGDPVGVEDRSISNTVARDLSTGSYRITTSSGTIRSSQLNESSVFFRMQTVPVWPYGVLDDGTHYVVATARLEPIDIHATGKRYDLMALWNYREPSAQSEPFTRRDLSRRRVEPP